MELMTMKETQEYLRKSKSALYRDIKKGIIPFVKIGGKPLVIKNKLDRYIIEQLNNGKALYRK
ncbi:MAG: helix-turn-helix domain-containing protein [Candidatus Omnitrophica bacterium]|nr:helix-turn-helix domain-containing protein [Candidatus Omnitrophota bacterium]